MVIDRIEGAVAVVELAKGSFRDVPLSSIDGRARDGAVLVERGGRYAVDEAETTQRAEAFAKQRERLFKQ